MVSLQKMMSRLPGENLKKMSCCPLQILALKLLVKISQNLLERVA